MSKEDCELECGAFGSYCLCNARESEARSSKRDLLFGTLVTAEGQVKVGDKLQIIGKNDRDTQTATVMEILSVNGREEVLINVERNYYFITELLISGQSWASEVRIISAE